MLVFLEICTKQQGIKESGSNLLVSRSSRCPLVTKKAVRILAKIDKK
jgi:hypothetical protein